VCERERTAISVELNVAREWERGVELHKLEAHEEPGGLVPVALAVRHGKDALL
jgi:hypothetical protein